MKTLTFETGASDHHKRIDTMLRAIFTTREPNKIFHHFYKNFKNEKFDDELREFYSLLGKSFSETDFESFQLAFNFTLKQFAPLKQTIM